jgi:GNAT superfamily N-acetyltransferase
MPSMSDFTIAFRVAAPGEVARAIAIDNACEAQFAELGVVFELTADHPYVVAERETWRRAAERGDLQFATLRGEAIGFTVLAELDALAYLEQLSVLPAHGRRGIGRALLERACEAKRAAGARDIWLTTYDHIPWNRPFYERAGFRRVEERDCGSELRATLAAQRGALPQPERRIAMRRPLG